MDTYEKKLKEALNDNTTDYEVVRWIEQKFPELKESEDKRIKKIIKNTLQSYNRGVVVGSLNAVDYADCIAWLEKQGEQKPQRIVSAEAKEALYDKPDWSEKDTEMIGTLVAIFEVNYPNGFYKVNPVGTTNMQGIHSSEIIKWLKSIKDKVQPKQEWSEEDEKIRQDAIGILRIALGNSLLAGTYFHSLQASINWLKSIKPQNRWKPSEEQIDALEDAIADAVSSIQKNMLNSLYNDLKKLKQ